MDAGMLVFHAAGLSWLNAHFPKNCLQLRHSVHRIPSEPKSRLGNGGRYQLYIIPEVVRALPSVDMVHEDTSSQCSADYTV